MSRLHGLLVLTWLAVAVVGLRDATTPDIKSLDEVALLDDGDSVAPPTSAAPPTKPQVDAQKVAAPAVEVVTQSTEVKAAKLPSQELPPEITGGTEGSFSFAVGPWGRQLGEVSDTKAPAKSTTATAVKAPAKSKSAKAPTKAEGKGTMVPAAGAKSKKNTKKKTKSLTKVARAVVDKSNKSLFDLLPLFMGIQANPVRRMAMLGGKCVQSLNDIVYSNLCKFGHKSKKDGSCSAYKMPPMSVAMQTLYKNAQTNYCKNSNCDASLCVQYGGPTDARGLQTANAHVMKDYPLWTWHNQTMKNKKIVPTNETIIAQLVDFNITMKKVVFCEKIDPPMRTADGVLKSLNCHTSRRCKMESLQRKGCREVSCKEGQKPPTIACPTDAMFVNKTRALENSITATLCAQL